MRKNDSWVKVSLLASVFAVVLGPAADALGASSREAKVQGKLEKAREHLEKGELAGAKRGYQRALKLSDGRSVEAALGLARVEIVLEDYSQAIEHVRGALEVSTDSEDQALAHYLFGQASFLRSVGEPKRSRKEGAETSLRAAETALRKAVALGPPVREAAAVLLLEVLLWDERRDDARKAFSLLEAAEIPDPLQAHADAIRCELDSIPYDGKPELDSDASFLSQSSESAETVSLSSFPATEGTAIIVFVVDFEGAVRCTRALRSYSPRATQRLISQVESSRYEPARLAGEPIAVRSGRIVVLDTQPVAFSGTFAAPVGTLSPL